ncbi:MAG: type II secretion system F family protein [Candidatus Woesearchaeota archaeon]
MVIRTRLRHMVAIFIALILIFVDIKFFMDSIWWIPLLAISISLAWIQYWFDFFKENNKQRQIADRFPEFVRNLVGVVKSGMPIAKAIQHVAETDYGYLTPYIRKLSYKIEWGIPVHKALLSFAESTENNIIKRAISTVIEAELSGGNLEDVLDSITDSLFSIKKIKDKRKAAMHTQIVQNYIIFFVFLGVMIVIQNMLIPYILELQQGTSITGEGLTATQGSSLAQEVDINYGSISGFVVSMSSWFVSIHGIFLMLALIQGLFAGLVIGKLSEGAMKLGIKHSFILMSAAFFAMTFAQGLA